MKRNSKKQTDQDCLCGICLKRKANVDCCSHQFCSTCIKDWVKGQAKSCPLCRRDVNTIISIKTGGILYNVRREPDHVPTIQREPDNQESSILDSSHHFESDESHYEEQSSIVSEILGYFGYSAEQQESQNNSISQKPKRKREKTTKGSKQKPTKTLGGDQILSKLQTEKQKESQNKKPSSAFHKRNKKQQGKALANQQIRIEKKKIKKQELEKVQSQEMNLEDESQQNEEQPFFNSKIVQERSQANKSQEREIQIQRESQKRGSVIRQSKLKQKAKAQQKSVLRSKQAEIKKALNNEDIDTERQNFIKDKAYRRQQHVSKYQPQREKDGYGRRERDDYAKSQYNYIGDQYNYIGDQFNKIGDQYNNTANQQRQRKQELRSQILAYENQKKRKEQQFRKQYERMMQQKKKNQKTGIVVFISQYKWILGCLGVCCCCCCRCCCLC